MVASTFDQVADKERISVALSIHGIDFVSYSPDRKKKKEAESRVHCEAESISVILLRSCKLKT